MKGDKDAHKATEAKHEGATKGHISNAQGHAKDAAKQTVGAADAKKDQAKSGKTVCAFCMQTTACHFRQLVALPRSLC